MSLREQLGASLKRLAQRIDQLAAWRTERAGLAGDSSERAASRRRTLDVKIRASELDNLPDQLRALKMAITKAQGENNAE